MGQWVWAVRLGVAAVFTLAAYGKLADRAATRQAVREFGIPVRFAAVAGWALPATELMVAVAVLPSATAVAACAVAFMLLVVFSTAVAVQLRRGRHPDCSCFGVSTAPISAWTLARNAGISLLVAAALWGSWTHAEVPTDLPAEQAAGLAIAVALAAVQLRQADTLRVLRRQLQHSHTARPAEGLPVGAVAPDFDLPGTDGQRGSLAGLLAVGRPVLLVFLHPTCSPCQILAGDLAQWRKHHHTTLTLMPIGSGDLAANTDWGRQHDLGQMLVQQTNEIAVRYQLRGAPTAVLIDPRGRIAAPPAPGPKAVRELLTYPTPQPARA